MKKRLLMISLGFLVLIAFIIYSIINAFGPIYEQVEIKQNIGGVLICDVTYIADHHSWTYLIDYKYQLKGKLHKIGEGEYAGREWEKDEQLTQFKNWTILKTGNEGDYDKIIVGDLTKNTWTSYEFSPENIENEKLWRLQDINSLPSYVRAAYITNIKNDEIELHYKFRTDANSTGQGNGRNLYYQIDSVSGKPILKQITRP